MFATENNDADHRCEIRAGVAKLEQTVATKDTEQRIFHVGWKYSGFFYVLLNTTQATFSLVITAGNYQLNYRNIEYNFKANW